MKLPYLTYLVKADAEGLCEIQTLITDYHTAIRTLIKLLADILLTIMLLVFLAWVNWIILLTIVLTFNLIIGLCLFLVRLSLVRLGATRNRAERTIIAICQSVMQGFKKIRLFQKSDLFTHNLEKNYDKSANASLWMSTYGLLPRQILEIALVLLLLLMLLAQSGGLVFSASVKYEIILFGVTGLRLLQLFTGLSNAFVNLRNYVDSINKIYAGISDIEVKIQSVETQVPGLLSVEKTFHSLRTKNLSFSYPRSKAQCLNSIDLTLVKGDIVGISGASDSGKATLLDMLAGFVKPTKASTLINDKLFVNYPSLEQ